MWKIITVISIILLVHIISVFSASLSSKVTLCKRSDPAFNACMKSSITQALRTMYRGSKAFDLPQFDPMLVSRMDLGEAHTGAVSLKQLYENMEIHGTSKCIIEDVSADFNGDNCRMKLLVTTPESRMDSDYVIKGQVLVFPINGHGRCSNKLYNLKAVHDMKCKKIKRNNKTYYEVVDYKFTMEPERVVFDFQNLIPDNPQISNEILKTVNENALVVFKDVKPGFEQSFTIIHKNLFQKFFNRVPEEELFQD